MFARPERPRTSGVAGRLMNVQLLRTATRTRSAVGAETIGRLAVRALHAELVLTPKPGLVTPVDQGSHRDMDASTFLRSLWSLRHYFTLIADAGARGAEFHALRDLGIAAETRMLRATAGINTHRGAIFSLGLLSAACGAALRAGLPFIPRILCEIVRSKWGSEIAASNSPSHSHGAAMRRRFGVGGARMEAAFGFPTVLRVWTHRA